MCYLGVGDTFTPCHKDLCASSGQNLMCYTENNGSSFWFMTETSSAPAAAEYFHSLNQELDHETHVITVEELAKAPFDVYIAEQKLGDLVLVPPRSIHQVVNNGGITIKMSWSRMTLDGLTSALYHELPIYRRVCRVETYQVKATLYHTLLRCAKEIEALSLKDGMLDIGPNDDSDSKLNARQLSPKDQLKKDQLFNDLRRLLELFDDVLVEEYSEQNSTMPCLTVPTSAAIGSSSSSKECPGQGHITCDFCSADIFQSFFECHHCIEPVPGTATLPSTVECGDGLVLCPSCYVEGRTCRCGSMTPAQCRPFSDLLRDRHRIITLLETLSGVGGIFLDNAQLFAEETLGLFQAACTLHGVRKSKKEFRACSFRNKEQPPSHTVPFSSARPCSKCHASKCFSCILEDMWIHSAEALYMMRSDGNHERWHSRHHRTQYEQARSGVIEASRTGKRPELRHRLVYTALSYRRCQPANATLIKPGWYDRVVNVIRPPIERQQQALAEIITSCATLSTSCLQPNTSTSSKLSAAHSSTYMDLFLDLDGSTDLLSPPSPLSSISDDEYDSPITLPFKRKRPAFDFDCVLLAPSNRTVRKRQAPTESSVAPHNLEVAFEDERSAGEMVSPPWK
jgi:hypothetical protein